MLKFIIAISLIIFPLIAEANENSCISPEQEKKFYIQLENDLKNHSLIGINTLLNVRELAFKDGALNTIDRIDEHLSIQISSMLILDNLTIADVKQIKSILSIDSYYPLTWELDYRNKIKERVENKLLVK